MRTRQQTRLLEESGGEQGRKPSHINFESGDLKALSKGANKSPVQNKNYGSVNSTNGGPPQRKKRALEGNSKTQHKLKGKLSGVVALPVELFMEIIQYLSLPDVLSLSFSNKFFHSMLMTRSVATLSVWRTAVSNVPGLPPCPEDLCEPQYATLIYSKHCSMCGASVVRPMDPYLNIRLCKDCTEEHVTHVRGLRENVQDLVHQSWTTQMKASRHGMRTCLIRDKVEVEEWYKNITVSRLNGSMSNEEAYSEIEKRENVISARLEYAMEMKDFLTDMAEARNKQIDQLKEQRRHDVKRRLEAAGWSEPDWTFPQFVARKWATLVEAPQALTDRAWQKLYPSLVPYLEKNRQSHIERSEIVRKGKRLRRMRRLLLAIRNNSNLFEVDDESSGEEADDAATDVSTANSPTGSGDEANSVVDGDDNQDSDMEIPNPLTPIPPSLRVAPPFPPMVDLLKWPIISELLDADTDLDTLQAQFEESKDEIEHQINSWEMSVEEELVDILNTGRAGSDDSEDKYHNAGPSSEEYFLQLELEAAPKSSLVDRLPPDTRLLLRADSVFRVSDDIIAPLPLYFPEMLSVLQHRPDGYCTSAFRKREQRPKHGYTWDSSEVLYYPEGCVAAKALLRQLGRENAAQYELQALGARFTCGSCGDNWLRTWNEMVQHYAETIVHAGIAKEAEASIKKQVKYKNAHRLDLVSKSKTKGKPLIVLHSEERAKTLETWHWVGERLVKCKLCEQLGIEFRSLRDAVREHIRTVHSVKPPKAENYKWTYDTRHRTKVDDPTGFVSDSTQATDPGIMKKIASSSCNPGTAVFWSHYGPHSRIHPGWDREDF